MLPNPCEACELKCRPASYKYAHQVYDAWSHTTPTLYACALACSCLHMCLRAAGLADSGIIFGRASPSLWRASLRRAGSLRLPLSVRESGQARPSRLADYSGAQLAGLVARARPSSKNTVLHTDARLLAGSGALRFHLRSASGSRWSHPLSENRHSHAVLQCCVHACRASQCWEFATM